MTHKCQRNKRLAIFPTHIDGNSVSDKVTFPNRKWEKLDYSINDIGKWQSQGKKSELCLTKINPIWIKRFKCKSIFLKSSIKYYGKTFIILELGRGSAFKMAWKPEAIKDWYIRLHKNKKHLHGENHHTQNQKTNDIQGKKYL